MMNAKDITNAVNAIRFEVEFDTNRENKNIRIKGIEHMATLMPVFPC